MPFVRLAIILLVVLTIVYIGLFLFLREAKRDRLERDYQGHATERERDAFVNAAVDTYGRRIRLWLAGAVYGVPVVVLAVVIYVTNV